MASPLIHVEDGTTVRDLNKNGKLDPYEDPHRPIEERVKDLLAQMTLEEKAGLMFHTVVEVAQDGSLTPNIRYSQASITEVVAVAQEAQDLY